MRRSPMTNGTLEIDLPDSMWQIIDRLAKADEMSGGTAEGLITNLLDHVQQGVYRSGSWERGWLCQCIGEDAIEAAYRPDDDPINMRRIER